ncbi:hypothetical protein ACLB2K_046821 [Fragaria x ananassa]
MISPIFFVFSVILSSSYASHVQDFCVADYTAPQSFAGFACKDPAKVTVDDFVFSGLVEFPNTTNIYKSGFKAAVAPLFPALNGLGVSVTIATFEIDGGRGTATVFVSFSSENPGTQILETALFQSDLPTEIIAKTTLLDLE